MLGVSKDLGTYGRIVNDHGSARDVELSTPGLRLGEGLESVPAIPQQVVPLRRGRDDEHKETVVDGVKYIHASDRTAVFLDARDPEEFSARSLSGARNLPASGLKPGKDVGEVKKAKDDGRLPMEDHNTRIVVFGRDGAQARLVAEAVVNEAFHNVAFFDGPFPTIKAATP